MQSAYEINQSFGLLQLSSEFKRALHDITCHTMKEEFFNLWSEFSADIPRRPMNNTRPLENGHNYFERHERAYRDELACLARFRNRKHSTL